MGREKLYCLFGLSLLLAACSDDSSTHTICKIEHEKGILMIKYDENDSWIYPSGQVFLYYKRKEDTKERFLQAISVNNDMGSLDSSNVIILSKTKEEIKFRLVGEEQDPEDWRLYYENDYIPFLSEM